MSLNPLAARPLVRGRRWIALTLAASTTALLVVAPSRAAEAAAAKVTICHQVGNLSYRVITVDVNAVTGGGHGHHAGDIIPAFVARQGNREIHFGGRNLGTVLRADGLTAAQVIANGCNVPPEATPAQLRRRRRPRSLLRHRSTLLLPRRPPRPCRHRPHRRCRPRVCRPRSPPTPRTLHRLQRRRRHLNPLLLPRRPAHRARHSHPTPRRRRRRPRHPSRPWRHRGRSPPIRPSLRTVPTANSPTEENALPYHRWWSRRHHRCPRSPHSPRMHR